MKLAESIAILLSGLAGVLWAWLETRREYRRDGLLERVARLEERVEHLEKRGRK